MKEALDESDIRDLKQHACHMRRLILEMGRHAGDHAAHMGAALSLVEILSVLYFDVMNTAEVGMQCQGRDRFILSKGHGCLGLYAALMEAGLMDEALADTFEDDGSLLLGHPVQNREIGIEFTNGSLGMGLSLGIGVALAARRKGGSSRIFVLLGDGECNEGSCWEAFMAAPHYGLDHLTVVIDQNDFQLSGANRDIMNLGNMRDKLEAFGWRAVEVDGHDVSALHEAFARPAQGKPLAIVAHTVKGKGFSFSENNNAWHHAIVTAKYYEQGLAELEGQAVHAKDREAVRA